MNDSWVMYLADAAVIFGLVVLTIAVYGMFWLASLYTSLHAASKSAFYGTVPILFAAALTGVWGIIGRSLLIFTFLFLTTPISAHVMAHAAYLTGVQITNRLVDRTQPKTESKEG